MEKNHATVKPAVKPRGMKTYSESRIELRNLQILKKMLEVSSQFLSSEQPCEPKSLESKVMYIYFTDFKGLLKYLVAKLHRCYPGTISLPVSQKNFRAVFSAPARRRFKSLFNFFTSLQQTHTHTHTHTQKKHFLLTFLLINGLLYDYNMCVVPLFFVLECFACRKMSSTYGRRLHVTLSC